MARSPFSKPLPGNQERTIGMWGINEPTTGSLSGPVYSDSAGSGGSVTTFGGSTDLEVSSDAADRAYCVLGPTPNGYTSGRFVTEFGWKVNEPLANLEPDIHVGQVTSSLPSSTNGEGARFVPSAGDDTDGNIEVEAGGQVTTGTISYPAVDDSFHYSAIVVDYDEGETRFHIDSNPFVDEADGVVDAVPNENNHVGGRVASTGVATISKLRLQFLGFRVVP